MTSCGGDEIEVFILNDCSSLILQVKHIKTVKLVILLKDILVKEVYQEYSKINHSKHGFNIMIFKLNKLSKFYVKTNN